MTGEDDITIMSRRVYYSLRPFCKAEFVSYAEFAQGTDLLNYKMSNKKIQEKKYGKKTV